MARKATGSRKTSAKADTATPPDPAAALTAALFAVTAEKGWRGVGMEEIAVAAGIDNALARVIFPTKAAILTREIRAVDAALVAEGSPAEENAPARERLFDVLMRRFDHIKERREALGRIMADLSSDPTTAAALACQTLCSMTTMLKLAGIETSGLKGRIRAKGLAGVWFYAMRAFVNDDSADLGKTMAALDKALERIDGLATRFRL